MEKELPESKQEELIKENESPELSENRQEIAEKSDSFPPQKITNPPTRDGVESETPPSEEEDENKEEPSPLGRPRGGVGAAAGAGRDPAARG